MDQRLTYFLILAASIAGPFFLSFDKKVHFYKKWKWLFPAMLFPALLYIGWDMLFTSQGIWRFNVKYITSIYIGHLPVEEVLFFFVVPYSCLFIYECIGTYFPAQRPNKSADIILQSFGVLLLIGAILFYKKAYTFSTFGLTALAIAIVYGCKRYFSSFNARTFLLAYAVTLLPFLVVNGFLTSLPVVEYNDVQNLGIRIYTIPVEDIFYGMLLVLMNVVIYEKLKKRAQ